MPEAAVVTAALSGFGFRSGNREETNSRKFQPKKMHVSSKCDPKARECGKMSSLFSVSPRS